jgi:hypothetical protein
MKKRYQTATKMSTYNFMDVPPVSNSSEQTFEASIEDWRVMVPVPSVFSLVVLKTDVVSSK